MPSNLLENHDAVYRFVLHVDEHSMEIVLFSGDTEVDRAHIESNRELLENLLPAIDVLLSKHSLLPKDVAHIRVESDLPDGYSSRRIAETVARTWRLGR